MLSQYSEYNAIAMLRITKQLEENCESSILNTFTLQLHVFKVLIDLNKFLSDVPSPI